MTSYFAPLCPDAALAAVSSQGFTCCPRGEYDRMRRRFEDTPKGALPPAIALRRGGPSSTVVAQGGRLGRGVSPELPRGRGAGRACAPCGGGKVQPRLSMNGENQSLKYAAGRRHAEDDFWIWLETLVSLVWQSGFAADTAGGLLDRRLTSSCTIGARVGGYSISAHFAQDWITARTEFLTMNCHHCANTW